MLAIISPESQGQVKPTTAQYSRHPTLIMDGLGA